MRPRQKCQSLAMNFLQIAEPDQVKEVDPLYWLVLNADRFRTELFQPIPVAPDAIFTSIRLSWGRDSPVFNACTECW